MSNKANMQGRGDPYQQNNQAFRGGLISRGHDRQSESSGSPSQTRASNQQYKNVRNLSNLYNYDG